MEPIDFWLQQDGWTANFSTGQAFVPPERSYTKEILRIDIVNIKYHRQLWLNRTDVPHTPPYNAYGCMIPETELQWNTLKAQFPLVSGGQVE